MNKIDEKSLEEIIKKILLEHVSSRKCSEPEKDVVPSGIVRIKGSSVVCESFDTGKPGDRVFLKDVITSKENRNLACGFMEMDASEFDWTLNYDEIDYVIEGTLVIKSGDREATGKAGDVIMIPKGSKISFSAPGYVKFLYVTYPANWNEG
jgi:ethanolamine utilization protein EutQ